MSGLYKSLLKILIFSLCISDMFVTFISSRISSLKNFKGVSCKTTQSKTKKRKHVRR